MGDQRFVVRVAVGLALGAALVHVWAMPGHFAEWWGYGAFFLLVAVAQGLYGLVLLARPGRALFFLGIGGNLAVVSSSRTPLERRPRPSPGRTSVGSPPG
jgi:hypothetical protein